MRKGFGGSGKLSRIRRHSVYVHSKRLRVPLPLVQVDMLSMASKNDSSVRYLRPAAAVSEADRRNYRSCSIDTQRNQCRLYTIGESVIINYRVQMVAEMDIISDIDILRVQQERDIFFTIGARCQFYCHCIPFSGSCFLLHVS